MYPSNEDEKRNPHCEYVSSLGKSSHRLTVLKIATSVIDEAGFKTMQIGVVLVLVPAIVVFANNGCPVKVGSHGRSLTSFNQT
eukprot:2355011-Amphidinium_carterae.1